MTEYERMHNGMIYSNIHFSFITGNPARVIRKITEQDSMYRKVRRD